MNNNPYKYIGPLNPDKDRPVCVERKDTIKRILDGIAGGDYWIILGPEQIGKTTLLRQIQEKNPQAHHIHIVGQLMPKDALGFFKRLKGIFLEAIPHEKLPREEDDWDSSEPEYSYYRFLEKFTPLEKEKKMIVLVDDVDGLPHLETFLSIWRKVFTLRDDRENLKRYSVIIAGSQALLKVAVGMGSPFNIAMALFLRDFTPEESRMLVDEPLARLGITLSRNGVNKLVKTLNGHPQMLQHACRLLTKKGLENKKKSKLTEKDVNAVLFELYNTNSSLELLRRDYRGNDKLRHLIGEILEGKERAYANFKEFSTYGAGAIKKNQHSNCIIRNNLYRDCLESLRNDKAGVPAPTSQLLDSAAEQEPLITQFSNVDNLESGNDIMPRGLRRLAIRNYHGIRHIDLELPGDAKWIFLSGENAFGKTALLRAMVIGMMGTKDSGVDLIGDEEREARVAVEIGHNGQRFINQPGTGRFKTFPFFAAYGSSRLRILADESKEDFSEKSTKSYSLFNTAGLLRSIEHKLKQYFVEKEIGELKKEIERGDTETKRKNTFDVLKKILLNLLPHGLDIHVDRKKDEVFYIEKEENTEEGAFEPTRFENLAAGNKSIIAMIGDMLVRFYEEYEKQGLEVGDPREFSGIVIIDELDLHLHPRWLCRLPRLLSDIFPNIQFIASTHSEIPLLGAPKESLFLKVVRTVAEGVKVVRLPLQVKNLLSHHILSSPMFDLEWEDIPRDNPDPAAVRTENSAKEIEDTDNTIDTLRQFEAGDQDYPEVTFGDD